MRFKLVEDIEIDNPEQQYSSANTSINSSKLPAIFHLINFKENTLNLDYGGGKFDNATNFLASKNVLNLIYDPYNRTKSHNDEVLSIIEENNGVDTCTCSNVLNVIKEENVRLSVLNNIKKLLKAGGVAYFTIYEGTGLGVEGETKAGYQLNRRTGDYIGEISRVFSYVERRGKLIIAKK